ncbi:MAG: TonB-dependent receptor [Arachidicoccus sp.]|nr:TonB-dependent receptor [Arachidicoccus sp.]
MKFRFLILSILFFSITQAQTKHKILHFLDKDSKVPIANASIFKKQKQLIGITDNNGNFEYLGKAIRADSFYVQAIGFEPIHWNMDTVSDYTIFYLIPSKTMLSEVVITANNLNPYHAISQTDIRLRGVSNSQEVLRIVPGLFIGQHQGGGKAEQIFLRGFDNDHGTDINLSVDGMPINMVSHAHGQGYADSHFIIPETIESTNYEKGMYNTSKGDLAVTGFAAFHTTNALDKNVIKVEGGQFDTYRALGMFSLLPKSIQDKHSWYIASEYRYSNAYFDHPQHFKRFNFFTKYTGQISGNSQLTLSASTMHSSWLASGQIPEIAVEQGLIGFYGAIDPNEGGNTNRTNGNAQLITHFQNGGILQNQLYFSHYTFDLNSNFTFFLTDSINGDELRQREHRNLVGYNGSYAQENSFGNVKVKSTLGWNTRLDYVRNISLSHTVNRYTIIDPIKSGNINEQQADIYLNEEFTFSPKWTLDVGVRYDYLHYLYDNQLATDTTLPGIGKYTAHNAVVSPKFKLSYLVGKDVQLYLFAGKGFHSNDARVVVVEGGKETLPAAYGSDLGIVAKPVKNLLLNAAVWYSYLQKEYVYGGDGGSVEFSGRTRRIGIDFSGRSQPFSFLYLDMDINYAHGRSMDDPKHNNYIPLAPIWSSTGGVTFIIKNGFNGSVRYRYMGDRPANDDYSLTAEGYFITDFVLNYTTKKFEIGMTINNLFNTKWKETQFDTYFRLKGQQPVDGIAFTPGTKFASLLHLSYFF